MPLPPMKNRMIRYKKEKTENRHTIRLLISLARNDLRARYSSSVLGALWAFVMPLVTILVFWYVFQLGFKNLPVGDAPYILWFSTAYIPWVFFSDAVSSGSSSLLEYSYLVKKIRFDVRIIPAIKVISALFVHLFFVAFLFAMAFLYRYPLGRSAFQVLYYMACAGLHALALSYLLSAFTVFFKDTASILSVILQVGFWATPILWNEEQMVNGSVQKILRLNPMHYVIQGYRDSLLFGKSLSARGGEGLYFWVVTLVLLLAGFIVFKRLSPFFADEV